jgi:hypothetical protein
MYCAKALILHPLFKTAMVTSPTLHMNEIFNSREERKTNQLINQSNNQSIIIILSKVSDELLLSTSFFMPCGVDESSFQ